MFIVGACTALLLRHGARPPVGARMSAVLCAGAVIFCWQWRLHPTLISAIRPGIGVYDALLIPFFALMLAAFGMRDASRGRSLLARRPVVFLGEISFAFYLVHYFVLDCFRHYGYFARPLSVPQVLPLLVALGVTVAVAWMLHAGVERPVERRLRALSEGRPR
jgi:peptidoglycan/LPS O-acetylase OafA/YrhL